MSLNRICTSCTDTSILLIIELLGNGYQIIMPFMEGRCLSEDRRTLSLTVSCQFLLC